MIMYHQKKAFTLIEMLLTITIFTLVIGGYVNYMSTQNKQVTTITQHSQANEIALNAVQAMSFDIKSAKRGEILIGDESNPQVMPCVRVFDIGNSKTLSLIRSKENPDIKKSDQLYLEKVDYTYDPTKKTLTKSVSEVKLKKVAKSSDGKKVFPIFEIGPAKSTKTFNNISNVTFKPIKAPGLESKPNVLAIGVEVESTLANNLIGQPQVGRSRTNIFINDEIAFKNQPNWNVNPVFSNSLVNITLSPPLKLDFTSALEIVNWLTNFKSLVPQMVNDAKNQILEKTMIALTGKVLEQAQNLYSKFINDAAINSMINSLKSNFVDMVNKATKDPNLCAAAALLSDAFNNGNVGEVLKNKIINKALENADIDNVIEKYGQKLVDTGVISQNELRKVVTFKDPSKAFEDEIKGTQAEYQAVIDKIRNKIYNALPTENKIADMVNSYVVSLSDKLRLAMKDDIKLTIGTAVVSKVVNDKVNEAIDFIFENSGLQKVKEDPNMNDVAKALLNEIEGMLKNQIKGLASNLIREVTDSIAKEIVTQFKDKEEALQKATENIPDPVNSMISLLSKKFLVAEKWDDKLQKFVPNPNATNYLDKIFKGFNLPLPQFDADKDAREALDKFYANNNLDNPFKK